MSVVDKPAITDEPDALASDVMALEAMTDETLYTEALNWANDVRAEYNTPPLDALPQGIAAHPGACVMANALFSALEDGTPAPPGEDRAEPCRYGSGTARFVRDGKWQQRPVPSRVQEFMIRFDAGHYPDLQSAGAFRAYVSAIRETK